MQKRFVAMMLVAAFTWALSAQAAQAQSTTIGTATVGSSVTATLTDRHAYNPNDQGNYSYGTYYGGQYNASFFSVDLTAATKYKFDLNPGASGTYDYSLVFVMSSTDPSSVLTYGYGYGSDSIASYTPGSSATYYVACSDYFPTGITSQYGSNYNSSSTGTLTITQLAAESTTIIPITAPTTSGGSNNGGAPITAPNAYNPNDSGQYSYGSSYTYNACIFSTSLVGGTKYNFKIDDGGNYTYALIFVMDSSKNVLATGYDYGSGSGSANYTPGADGTYYVACSAYYPDSYSTYGVVVSFNGTMTITQAAAESTTITAISAPSGGNSAPCTSQHAYNPNDNGNYSYGTYYGTTYNACFFSTSLTGGTKYGFKFSTGNSSAPGLVFVIGTDRTSVLNYSGGSSTPSTSYTPGADGTYYVCCSSYYPAENPWGYSASFTGSLDITVSSESTTITAITAPSTGNTAAVTGAHAYNPNDAGNYSYGTYYGSTYNACFFSTGLTGGAKYTFSHNTNNSVYAIVFVIDTNRTSVLATGYGYAPSATYTASADGTYYVCCSAYYPAENPWGYTTSYTGTLDITQLAAESTTITAITAPSGNNSAPCTSGHQYNPNDSGNYSYGSSYGGNYNACFFSTGLTGNSKYAFAFNTGNSQAPGIVFVIDTNRTSVLKYSSGSSSTNVSYTPTADGTYYVCCSAYYPTGLTQQYGSYYVSSFTGTLDITQPAAASTTILTISAPGTGSAPMTSPHAYNPNDGGNYSYGTYYGTTYNACFFSTSLTGNTKYNIGLDTSNSMYSLVFVMTSTSTSSVVKYSSAGYNPSTSYTPSADGTYYIACSSYYPNEVSSSWGVTTSYTGNLNITVPAAASTTILTINSPGTASAPVTSPHAYNPNNNGNYSYGTYYGTTYNGCFFSTTMTGGTKYNVALDTGSSAYSLLFMMTSTSSVTNNASGYAPNFNYTPGADGTYYVCCSGYYPVEMTQNYGSYYVSSFTGTLNITVPAAASTTILTIAAPGSATAPVTSEHAYNPNEQGNYSYGTYYGGVYNGCFFSTSLTGGTLYKFSLDPGQSGSTYDYSLVFVMTSTSASSVVQTGYGYGNASSAKYTPGSDGTYYVACSGYFPTGMTQSYGSYYNSSFTGTLTITTPAGPSTTVTAITVPYSSTADLTVGENAYNPRNGSWGSGYTFNAQVYSVPLSAGTKYTFSAGYGDAYIYLMTGLGTGVVAQDDDSGGGYSSQVNARLYYTPGADATYYYCVTTYGPVEYGYSFQASVDVSGAASTASTTITALTVPSTGNSAPCTSEHAYNPNANGNYSYGTYYGGVYNASYFSAGLTGGTKYKATFNPGSSNYGLLFLINTDRATVMSTGYCYYGSTGSVSTTPSADGTYYLCCSGYYPTGITDMYGSYYVSSFTGSLDITSAGSESTTITTLPVPGSATANVTAPHAYNPNDAGNYSYGSSYTYNAAYFCSDLTGGTQYKFRLDDGNSYTESLLFVIGTDNTSVLTYTYVYQSGTVSYTPSSDGHYYVCASAYYPAEYSSYGVTVSYTGTVYCSIPAGMSSTVTAITVPGTYSVDLTSGGNTYNPRNNYWGSGYTTDAQVYSFTLTAGTGYQIDTTGGDTYIYLMSDLAGTIITEDDDGGGYPNSRIKYTPTADGTYYLCVTTYGPEDWGYAFTASLVIQANTNTMPPPTVQGGTVVLDYSAAINTVMNGPSDRSSFYGFQQTISVDAGKTYYILLEYTGGYVTWPGDDNYLYVYDGNGNYIGEDDDSGVQYMSDQATGYGAAFYTYSPQADGQITVYCTTYANVQQSSARLYITVSGTATHPPPASGWPNAKLAPRQAPQAQPAFAWNRLDREPALFINAVEAPPAMVANWSEQRIA